MLGESGLNEPASREANQAFSAALPHPLPVLHRAHGAGQEEEVVPHAQERCGRAHVHPSRAEGLVIPAHLG
ncbi:unnamed protein product [Ectocarpus sp. 12 AP-2014]